MTYDGYLEFSGTEICNVARTLRYVEHQAPGLGVVPRPVPAGLHLAVGDAPYESPLVDDAPWFDPATPATSDFFGLYPLEIQGLVGSTLSASVTERIDDGGSIGAQREGSKSIRVHGLLVGATELATAAGLSWLRNTLRRNDCSGPSPCGGADLRFFLAEPQVAEAAFGPETIGSGSETFGTIAAGRTTSHRWSSDELHPAMPAELRWTGAFQEGSGFVVGVRNRLGDTVLSEDPPVFPYRRNYVPNPSLRTDLSGYFGGTGSQLVWALEDGADGTGYGQVTRPDPVVVPTTGAVVVDNHDGTATTTDATDANDGTGVFPLAIDGGSGIGTLTTAEVPIDTGSRFGELDFGEGDFGGVGDPVIASPTERLIGTPILPIPAGPVVASVSVRAANGALVTLQIRDARSSAVLGTATIQTSGDWQRIGATGQSGLFGIRLVVVSESDFDVDLLLAERGALQLDYFDGATLLDGATIAWEGEVDASTSVLTVPSIDLCWPDSDILPYLTCLQGGADQLRLTWQLRRTITLDEQLLALDRSFHEVTCTQGVNVINEIRDRDGWYIEVDFVLTAAQPGLYAPAVSVPTIPVATAPFSDPATLVEPDDLWLYDPQGFAPTVPPAPPTVIPDGMVTAAQDWLRYYVTIPADDVALGGKTIPTIGIDTFNRAASAVRIRFHPNPFNYPADAVDPLSYCAETIVSYLPPQTRLVLNGVNRQAVASKPGKATVSADHLLYGADGAPMTWPDLTCGVSYVLTVDVPAGSTADDFAIDLQVARRE